MAKGSNASLGGYQEYKNQQKDLAQQNQEKGLAQDPSGASLSGFKNYQKEQDYLNPNGSMPIDVGIQSNVTGFDLDEYTKYVRNIRSVDNIDVKRAYGQSNWAQAGNAIIQTAGTIAGDTVSGIGAIGEIVSYLWDDNRDFDNAMMRFGDSISDGSRELAPIYREAPGKAFDVGDFAWWASSFPSLVSTVSAMIPGYGAVKGIGMIGKAAKAAKFGKGLAKAVKAADKASDLAKATTNTLITAGISRNAENMREAADVYNSGYAATLEELQTEEGRKKIQGSWAYDDAKAFYGTSDLTDEQIANYIAAKGAQRTYNTNWINIGFDVAQAALPFFKGVRGLSRLGVTSKGLAEAQNQVVKGASQLSKAQKFKFLSNPYTSVVGGSLTEGIEEAINFIGGAEGTAYMEHMKGNYVDPFDLRLKSYFKDGHLYEAAVLGIAGGALFSGGQRYFTSDQRKQSQDNRIAEIAQRGAKTAQMYARIQEILDDKTKTEKEKEIEIDNIIDQVAYYNGIRAAVNGNVGLALEEYDSDTFKNKILELGITPEQFDKVNNRVKSRIEYAEKMYGKYRGNPLTNPELGDDIKSVVNAMKVHNAGAMEQYRIAKEQYENAYQEELKSIPVESRKDPNFEANVELAAIQAFRKEHKKNSDAAAEIEFIVAVQQGKSKEEALKIKEERLAEARKISQEAEAREKELIAQGAKPDKSRANLVKYKQKQIENLSLEKFSERKLQELDQEEKQRQIKEEREKSAKAAQAKAKKAYIDEIKKGEMGLEALNDIIKNESDKDVVEAAKEAKEKLRTKSKNAGRAEQTKKETSPNGKATPGTKGAPAQGKGSPNPAGGTPDVLSPVERIRQARGEKAPTGAPSTPKPSTSEPSTPVPVTPPDSMVEEAAKEEGAPTTQDNLDTSEAQVKQIASIFNDKGLTFDEKLAELVRLGYVLGFDENGSPSTNIQDVVLDLDGSGRDAIYFKINGVIIPMYRSQNGTDGKSAGQWYPFFFPTNEWIVKGVGNMSSSFGNPVIKRLQSALNKNFTYDSPRAINSISAENAINVVLGDSASPALAFGMGINDPLNYELMLQMLSEWQEALGPISINGLTAHLNRLRDKIKNSNNDPALKESLIASIDNVLKAASDFRKKSKSGQDVTPTNPKSTTGNPQPAKVDPEAPVSSPSISEQDAANVQATVVNGSPGAPVVPTPSVPVPSSTKPPIPGAPSKEPGDKDVENATRPDDGSVSELEGKEDGTPVDDLTQFGFDENGNPVLELEVRNNGLLQKAFNTIAKIFTIPGKPGFYGYIKAVTQNLFTKDNYIQQKFVSLEALSNLVAGDTVVLKKIPNGMIAVFADGKEIAWVSTPQSRRKVDSRFKTIAGADAHYVKYYNKLSAAIDAKGEVEVQVSSITGGNKVTTPVSSSVSEDFSDYVEEYDFVMGTKESGFTELHSPNSIKGESVTASKVNNSDGIYSPEGVYVLVPTFGGQLMPVKITMANAGDVGMAQNLGTMLYNMVSNPNTDTAKGTQENLRENFVTGDNGIQVIEGGIKFRIYKPITEVFKGDNLVEVTINKIGDKTYQIVETDLSTGKSETLPMTSASYLQDVLFNYAKQVPLRINKEKLNVPGEFEVNGRKYNSYNEFVAQNATHNLAYIVLPSGKKLFVSPYSAGKVGDAGYRPGVTLKITVPNEKRATDDQGLPRVSATKIQPQAPDPSVEGDASKVNLGDSFGLDLDDDPIGLGMSATGSRVTDGREPVDLDKMETEWREMFPNIPFVRVKGLIRNGGELAFGLFTESAVYLSTNALPGTHYHEAFHTAMHLYTSEEERAVIYKEGRALLSKMSPAVFKRTMQDLGINANSVSELTDLQVEEFLAERFRSQMIAGEISATKTPKTAIGRFFQTLIRMIQDFVGINRQPMYERLFKNIKGGKFNYEPTAQMRNHAKNLKLNLRVRNYTNQEKAEAVRATTVLMDIAYEKVLSEWDRLSKQYPNKTFEEIVKQTVLNYLEIYKGKGIKAAGHPAAPNVAGLQKAIDNYETTEDGIGLYEESKSVYKAKFGRDLEKTSRILESKKGVVTEETTSDEELDISIEELADLNTGLLIKNWDDSAAEYDKKKNASALVRSTILRSKKLSTFRYADSDAEVSITNEPNTVFGTLDFLDFDVTYNYMSTHLAGIKTSEELLAKLLVLSRANPSLGGIYLQLRENPQLAAAFTVEFQGQVVPIVRHTLNPDGTVTHQFLNVNEGDYSWARNWQASNESVGDFVPKFEPSIALKYAKEKKFEELAEYLTSRLEGYGIMMTDGSTNMLATYLQKELEHADATNNLGPVASKLISAVGQIGNSTNKQDQPLRPFRELAEMVSMYDIRMSQRTYRTAANTNIQGILGRNPIGDFFQLLNDPTKEAELLEYLSNLYKDPRARNSSWMRSLVVENNGVLELRTDPAAVRFKAEFSYSLDAGFENKGGNGKKASKVSDADFEVLELLSFMDGVDNRNNPQSQGNVAINPVTTPNNTQFNVSTPISSVSDLKLQLLEAFYGEIEAMKIAFDTYFYKDEQGNIQIKEGVTPPVHSVVDAKGNHLDEDGNLVGRIFKSHIFPGLEEKFFVDGEVVVTRQEIKDFYSEPIVKKVINSEISAQLQNFEKLNETHADVLRLDPTNEEAQIVAEHYALYKMMHNINMSSFFQGAASNNKDVADVFKRSNNASLVGRNLDVTAMSPDSRAGVNVMTGPDIKRDALSIEGGAQSPMFIAVQEAALASGKSAKEATNIANSYVANYKNISSQDAQGYITLERYEDILRGQGRWNKEWEKTFKAAKDGKLNARQLREFLVPIKAIFTGMVPNPESGLMEQHMIKYSAMPLIPQLMDKAPGLKTLHKAMKETSSQEYVPHSAYKLGATVNPKAAKTAKEFNYDNLTALPVRTLPHSTYRILQDVPPKLINAKTSFGAQISKLVLSNIDPNSVYMLNGKEIKGANLINLYNKKVAKYIDGQRKRLFKELGITQEEDYLYITNFEELSRRIERSFGKEPADVIKQAIEVDKDGKFRIPMHHPGISAKLEAIFTGMFTNSMIQLKVPGTGAVQASSVGFDGTEYRRPTLVFNEDGGIEHAEIYLPKHMASFFDGRTFKEIEQENPELLELLGFRIPTESKSTSATIKIIGFLPDTMANTVVVPDEFVVMMGSDFDLDKLMMMFRTEKDSISNEVLDIMTAVLRNPMHTLEVLTPQEPDALRSAAKKVSTEEEITLPYAQSTKRAMRSRDRVGEEMLGIAANINTLIPVAQVTDMYLSDPIKIQYPKSMYAALVTLYGAENVKTFKSESYVEVLHTHIGKSATGSFYGVDGNLITTNIKQFVGAAADNTKDPVFNMFNGNQATMNSIMLLTALGVPYDISFGLTTLPILEDYASASMVSKGVAGSLNLGDAYSFVVTNSIAQHLVDVGMLDDADHKNMQTLSDAVKKQNPGIENTYLEISKENIAAVKREIGLLNEMWAQIQSDKNKGVDVTAQLEDYNKRKAINLLKQGSLLSRFMAVKRSADSFSDAAKAFKMDNIEVGPNFTSAQDSIEAVDKSGEIKSNSILINGEPAARAVYPRHFNPGSTAPSAYAVLEAAFQAHLTADAMSRQLLPSETDSGRDFLKKLKDQNLLKYGQEGMVKAFINRAYIFVNSDFLTNTDSERVLGYKKQMANLSKPLSIEEFANLSTAEKVQYLKLHNKDLPFGNPNHILGRLRPLPSKGRRNKGLQVIEYENSSDIDVINSLSDSLEEMYFSEDPFISETAKDLVRYSFFTSGMSFGGRSFGAAISVPILEDIIYTNGSTRIDPEYAAGSMFYDAMYDDFVAYNLENLNIGFAPSIKGATLTGNPNQKNQIIEYPKFATAEDTPKIVKRSRRIMTMQGETTSTYYYKLDSAVGENIKYVQIAPNGVPGQFLPLDSKPQREEFDNLNTSKSKLAYKTKEGTADTDTKIQMLKDNFKAIGIDVEVVLDPTLEENAKVEGNGSRATITINPNSVFGDTVIHEFGHIYVDLLGVNHPLVKQAIEQLKGTQLWKDVEAAYPELSGHALAKEVVVTALGREGAELFNQEKPQKKWRILLNKIFRAIGKLFGVEPNAARELARQMLSNKMQRDFKGSLSETAQYQKRATSMDEFLKQKRLKLKRITEEYGNKAQDVERLLEDMEKFDSDISALELAVLDARIDNLITKTEEELAGVQELYDGDVENLNEEELSYHYEFLHNASITLASLTDLVRLDDAWGDSSEEKAAIRSLIEKSNKISTLLTKIEDERRKVLAVGLSEYVSNPDLQEDIMDIFSPSSTRKNDVSAYDESTIQLALDALADTNVPLVAVAVKMYKTEQEMSNAETLELLQDWEIFVENNQDVLESLFELDESGNRTGRWVQEETDQHTALMADPKKAAAYKYVMNLMTDLVSHTSNRYLEKGFIPAVPKEEYADVWNRIKDWNSKDGDINESIKVDDENNVIGVIPLAYSQYLIDKETEYLPIDEETMSREEIISRRAENRRRKEEAHAKLLDYNIADTMKLFISTSMRHKFKNKVETKMKLIGEEIKTMEFTQNTGAIDKIASLANGEPTQVKVSGKDSNIYKHYQYWMRMVFYEDFDQSGPAASKIARNLQNYMSVTGIGFNVYSALNNRVYGGIQMAMEAAAGEHFGKDEWAKAKAEYNKNSMVFFSNRKSSLGKNKTDAILKTFDILQHQDELSKRKGGPARSALHRLHMIRNAGYALTHAGEHVMQNQVLLAMLMKQQVKVNGKEMSLYDALEFKDGKIIIPDGVTTLDFNGNEVVVDKKYIARFKTKTLAVNQYLHGIYNKDDAGTIQRYALGRMAMQFRKWARPGFNKRFGSKFGKSFWNERRESLDEGMYITTWNLIKDIVTDGQKIGRNYKLYYQQLTPQQRANIKRTAIEMAYLAGAAGLGMLLANMGFDEDDEGLDAKLKASLVYQVDRTITELKTYLPFYGWLNEGKKLLASPVPAMSRLETAWNLLRHTVGMPFMKEEDKYFKGGRYYGESKFRIWSRQLLPVLSQADKFIFITNNARYYKLYD